MLLSAVAFTCAVVAVGYYSGKAELIQRVDYSEENEVLLGEPGPMIGSPQKMIIEDRKAFLKTRGPGEALQVDDNYLRENNIYPLQLKTVEYITGIVRNASIVIFALCGVGLILARKRSAT